MELEAGQLNASHLDRSVNVGGQSSGAGGVLTSVLHDRDGTEVKLTVSVPGTNAQSVRLQLFTDTHVQIAE